MEKQIIIDLIKQETGNEPQYDQPTCLIWNADHKNCKDCPSALPCCQLLSLLIVTLQGSQYQPTSFQDALDRDNRVANTMDKILHAKTDTEVKEAING